MKNFSNREKLARMEADNLMKDLYYSGYSLQQIHEIVNDLGNEFTLQDIKEVIDGLAPLKGMMVTVLYNSLGDCTNEGISKGAGSLLLVGEGIPPIFEAREGTRVVKLVRRNLSSGLYIHCEPVAKKHGAGYMMGGNFAYCCDSRFSELINNYPIPIHDRVE